MKISRRRIYARRCAHCGQRFPVNARLGNRHRFCSQAECAKASRRAARKKWLRKNGGKRYFSGEENGDRVRSWRKRNPKYWKRANRSKRSKQRDFVLTKSLAEAVRYVALQDTIDTRLALKIGLISELTGAALQDTIAKEIHRIMMRGYAIMRGQFRQPSK